MNSSLNIKQLIKNDLSGYEIENSALDTICNAIKAILALIIQYTSQFGNELKYTKLKVSILDEIETDNKILYDLKNITDSFKIKLDLENYIFKLYNAQNKNMTVSKNLIGKINYIANYYYIKFIEFKNKITNNAVIREIRSLFKNELADIILNGMRDDSDGSDSYNISDYEHNINRKSYSARNSHNTFNTYTNESRNVNYTNGDLFDTQLTLESDINKTYSHKFTTHSHLKSVPVLEIISTYKLE